MTAPLTDAAYEPIRAALFDSPPGQGAQAAKQAIADNIAANPWPFVRWLMDAGIVEHVTCHADNLSITASRANDTEPFYRYVHVAWVDQTYANHVGEPEAAFTDRQLAEAWRDSPHVSNDVRIEEVPLNPAPPK